MPLNSSTSTAEDGTASSVRNYSQSAGCSTEQILTPVSIRKLKSPSDATPGFRPAFSSMNEQGNFGGAQVSAVGPTVHELDPYFTTVFGDDGTSFISNCDYNVVIADPATDTNLKKNQQRTNIEGVRTQALRGPMILSGWGFDIGDMPAPASSDNPFMFDPNMINQRSYWKTGPVHLMWDDQRQVWCGGNQMVCGKLDGRIEAPESIDEPTSFLVKVFRRDPRTQGNMPGVSVKLSDRTLGESIRVVNRDSSLEYDGNEEVFCICVKINYEWLPIWVGCPGGGGSSSSGGGGGTTPFSSPFV